MKNSKNQKSCCQTTAKESKGIGSGLVYGLIPHVGCIAFIVFTILGVTTATALFKPLLLNPYFFYILIGLSLVFATISALVYLSKHGIVGFQNTENGRILNLSLSGIKGKWKYLSTLYGTTVFTNLLLFMVVFPLAANLNTASVTAVSPQVPVAEGRSIRLQVNIPCSGHAPLITDELKKISGVTNVRFDFPNFFEVNYDPAKTTKQQILSLDVFNTYKATVVSENSQQPSQTSSQTVSQYGCGASCGTSCGCGGRN